jgi:hypothetical protein
MEIPRIISVDDHVVEPPDLWSARLPEKYRDRGPRIERHKVSMTITGGYGFTVDGVICEYARVWFNGAMVETACCESENYAGMRKVVEALGMAAIAGPAWAAAEPITGRWVTGEKDAVVGIAKCGKALLHAQHVIALHPRLQCASKRHGHQWNIGAFHHNIGV